MKQKIKKAVIITAQGFEDEELIYPVIRLKEEGFQVDIATKNKELIQGRKNFPLSTLINFYSNLVDAKKLKATNYDLVIIPGGFEGPDRVRQIPQVLSFIRDMNKKHKIIAAVCHGPWVLISAGILKNINATCYNGIIDDLNNSGAKYQKKHVVISDNIITADHAKNIHEFMKSTLFQYYKYNS